jgi:hypothetical protein
MKMDSRAKTLIAAFMMTAQNVVSAMAGTPSIDDDKFKSMDIQAVPSMILGSVIWLLRLAGVVVLMTGIYKLTAARKDGEAEEMNIAMIKICIGLIFICFPAILKAVHILV